MEFFYTAYTKVIDDNTYYFVKKYARFPELKNAPAVLESYGMHTDFNKACRIAAIEDPEIKQRLFKELNPGLAYGYSSVPVLSKNLRVELINEKPSLVSKLSGIKKLISSKIPHWRLLPHS